MGTTTLPNQPSEITAELLTEVVKANGHDGVVESFSTRSLGEGVGMMSVLCVIDLNYASGSGPATMIGKFAATTEANLGVALHFDIYRRESMFYANVAPQIDMAVPALYFNEFNEGADFAMLMEDMSAFRTGDQVLGCTIEEAQACMAELVKLHAPLWDKVGGPEFEFAFLHAPSPHSEGMCGAAIAGWDPMAATFGDDIPAFMSEVRERYLAAVPAMQLWIAQPPITFVHGDYRLDNLMFATQPGQPPIISLDWQGVLRSKGIQDVAYLLSQSMDPELRRQHERELVTMWQQGLADAGVENYSVDDAWLDYRKAVLYLWVYVTVIAGALDANNERGKAFMSNMIRRSAAAIADLDGIALLGEFE